MNRLVIFAAALVCAAVGGPCAEEEPEWSKRVAFNAWGGKREEAAKRVAFNAGKREPRAFFPWGGKRSAEDDGVLEWGQPEEVNDSSTEVGEALWGRPIGRGRRSFMGPKMPAEIGDMAPWERKRLAALWRAAKLQPARQNRRAVGADFFPWGGKRSA